MKKNLRIILISIILLFVGMNIGNASNLSASNNPGYLEGYFLEAVGNNVSLEAFNGDKYRVPLSEDAEILIDNRPVSLKDFKAGMEIYIEVRGRRGIYMDSFSTTNPGYVQPNSKVVTGTIKSIDRDQIKVKLPTGSEKTYYLSPSTVVMKNGSNSKAKTLYVGDNIKMFFESNNSNSITRLKVEGKSVEIKNVYKGDMLNVEELTDNVFLNDMKVLGNNDWIEHSTGERLEFNNEVPIYMAGAKINNKNLKNYKGKTAYAAIKDELGQDRIEKLVLKNQYEMNFSTKIENVNWFNSQIELSNKQNISINEGTMIIKNGRLVDAYSLNPNSNAYIVADGKGGNLTASLINVFDEDINNSNIGQNQIYSGRVDKILGNKLSLKDFFLLDKNEWGSFDGNKDLFYDNETFIYDLKAKKEIKSKDLFGSKYSVDENNRNSRRNRDWYAYIYTDGDRISSIFLQEKMDSLLRQRTTIGIVESNPWEDPHMGMRITLRDGKDWSSSKEEWMAKNSSLYIYLEEAMIIKDDKRINIEDLKAGDRVYMTRDSNMAKVIIVK